MQSSSIRHCKNHPRRVGKRKCYRCGAALCAECQLLAHHHFFCGQRCRMLFLWGKLISTAVTPFRLVGERTVQVARVFSLRRVVSALVVAAVALLVFWTLQLERRLVALRQEIVALRATGAGDGRGSGWTEKLHITRPTQDAMVTINRISIEGESEPNRIISLTAGGRFVAVTLPQNGRFQFSEVPVRRGKNQLEVRAIAPDGQVTVLEVLEFVYNNPMVTYLARDFTRGDPTQPLIALTFDGGSVANVTPEILDILAEKGVRCTVFLTGEYMSRFPDFVRRIVEDGHEVGNHTWSHPHLTTFEENREHLTRPEVNRAFLHEELRRAAAFFEELTGTKMKPFWRAPFGEHNREIREWAAELGYRHIGWTRGPGWEETMDTLDWVADPSSPSYHSAEEIFDKILAAAVNGPPGLNGAVILMHLGSLRNGDFPHNKLPELIDQLRLLGYSFVTVSELVDL